MSDLIHTIGYDAKRIFHNRTGLGNFGRDTLRILAEAYPDYQYRLYNPKQGEISFPYGIECRPTQKWHKRFPSLWRSRWIISQLMKDNVQIFHGLTGELPYGIHKTSIKSVVTIHDLIFIRYPHLYKRLDRVIYERKARHACEVANKIVAISEQTKQDIISFLGVSEEKITVIYQGCAPLFKTPITTNKLNQVRQKYNLPTHFILSVGTVEERKNVLQVVKAMESIPNIPLIIVGRETPYAQEVKHYAETKGLLSRIRFLGHVSGEELVSLYTLASVFTYLSRFEGFGIPIVEAIETNTPVITNREGVFPEVGGDVAIYVDINDTPSIVNALEEALTLDKKSTTWLTKCKKLVEQFTDEKIASQWHKLYLSLMSDK